MALTARETSFVDAAKVALEAAAASRVERFVKEFTTAFPNVPLTARWYEQGTHTIFIDGCRVRHDSDGFFIDATGTGHIEELEAGMIDMLHSIYMDLDEITLDGRMDITVPEVSV